MLCIRAYVCLSVCQEGWKKGVRRVQGRCEIIRGKCRFLSPDPGKMVSLSFQIFHHLKQSLKASSGTSQLTTSCMFQRGSPLGRMVQVLTGLGFTASYCRAEDGIRAVESIPKANCLTTTRHISCSLILPPPYSSRGKGILRAKCSSPEGRCCMCLKQCDFHIVLLLIGPFIFIGNHGKYEKNHISVPRRQKVIFNMHTLCCGRVKGLREHPCLDCGNWRSTFD